MGTASEALLAYLHEHIPLSARMGTRIVEAGPRGVLLEAPLEPNLNHRETAFGGSVAALAILAGWTLVHLRLRAEGIEARTVIQRGDVSFHEPVEEAFRAHALPPDPSTWSRFLRTLARRRKGRVTVRVDVLCGGRAVGGMNAAYVSLTISPEP